MKDRIILCISRGKSHLNILYMGNIIGKIEVSDLNRGNQVSLKLSSNKEDTVYKIERLTNNIELVGDDDRFNREEFNR